MKIAINTSPLVSLHAGRGIGQYTKMLLASLKKYDPTNTYSEFADRLTEKPDIVHYPFFDIFQHTLKIYPQTKTIVTIHDLIPLKYPSKFPSGIRGKINWWLQKNMLGKIDAVITDSEASARDITSISGVPKQKIHVVPLAVAPEYKKLTLSEISRLHLTKYSLPKEFLLYVGDVNWNKNLPGLLKAFSSLIENHKFSRLHLVLVGSVFLKKDLPEVEELETIIQTKRIQDNVKMIGFVPNAELAGIYNLASLYVQPSFDEGFGLTPLEAMSCGLGVVSAKSGSLQEVVGDAGDYFDPTSHEDMVNVLKRALEYPEKEKARKIHLGLQQSKNFSDVMFAKKTINIYEHVCVHSSRSSTL